MTHDRTPTDLDELAVAFRAAWHKADAEGRKGERVTDGLRAALGPVLAERDELAANVAHIRRAMDDPGRVPSYHAQVRNHLRYYWPTLYNAIRKAIA